MLAAQALVNQCSAKTGLTARTALAQYQQAKALGLLRFEAECAGFIAEHVKEVAAAEPAGSPPGLVLAR